MTTTAPSRPTTSTLAAIALVMSMLMPPAGLCLGIAALREIARTGELGRGIAIGAIILGAAGFVVMVALLLYLGLLALALGQVWIGLGSE